MACGPSLSARGGSSWASIIRPGGARRERGAGEGQDEVAAAGAVRGVDDDRDAVDVGEEGDGAEVQEVPGRVVEAADAPLAEDDRRGARA